MSTSSDTDLETSITDNVARAKKEKAKQTTVAAENEGEDSHWAYAPPPGALLLDHTVDVGEFEWGAVKDDKDTEIWLIRAPESIKTKHLNGLEIDPPSSSRTARIGALTRKNASYDVWSIGDDDAEDIGAEELWGLSCLLPRKRKGGKLFIAPKQISRRIVISARPSTATVPEYQPTVYQNAPRPSYPKDLLKHAFVPYGARSQQYRSEDASMDVDNVDTVIDKPVDTAPSPKDKPAKARESRGKKRSKVDGESPKKSKKHKPNA